MRQDAGVTGQMSASKTLPTTPWSVVLAAGGQGEEARAALEKLCQIYWQPAHAFIRRRRSNPDSALDLTQQFFANIIANQDIAKLDRGQGRFRAWLYTAIKSALANDWYYETAQNRDVRKLTWLDGLSAEAAYQLEPRHTIDPERLFAHGCARAMYRRARALLRGKYLGTPKEAIFEAAIPEPQSDREAHRLLAASLDISENTLRQKISRMVIEFHKVLYQEIAQTVDTLDQIEDECRFLCEQYPLPREPEVALTAIPTELTDDEVRLLPDKPAPPSE